MNIHKKIFYTVIVFLLFCNIGFLFYYAYLMPLHSDEAGFWFNWTNKSILNRIFNDNVSGGITPPWHGLTIYLAKVSIYIFGNTGIGLRSPVIFFGILSSWLLYIFTKQVIGKKEVGLLAAIFLFQNPFFSHYSHELRGYPSLFFFSLCSYFCLFKLSQSKNNTRYLVWLFLSFLGCYLSNLASPLFFFTFLATVFIFKALQVNSYSRRKFQYLKNLNFQKLLIFSFVSSIVFSYLFFYFDASYLRVLNGYYGGQTPNVKAIQDFFSTFMGYKYLDDPHSEIYRYPVYIWLVSLICFLIGVIRSVRKNDFFAIFYLILLVVTSLFYAFSGSHIHTRSGIFLLPFMIMFQASGIVILSNYIVSSFIRRETETNKHYWVLVGFTIIYFLFLHSTNASNIALVCISYISGKEIPSLQPL